MEVDRACNQINAVAMLDGLVQLAMFQDVMVFWAIQQQQVAMV